jgi:hypothetical protein
MPQYRLFSVDQHGHVVKPPEYVTNLERFLRERAAR